MHSVMQFTLIKCEGNVFGVSDKRKQVVKDILYISRRERTNNIQCSVPRGRPRTRTQITLSCNRPTLNGRN